jgi:hypothetical protein
MKRITTHLYLHGEKETNHHKGREVGLTGDALDSFMYALYEVNFKLSVDPDTGEYDILTVNDKKLIDKTNQGGNKNES